MGPSLNTLGNEFIIIISFFKGLGLVLSILFFVAILFSSFALRQVFDGNEEKLGRHFFVPNKAKARRSPNLDRWENIVGMFKSKNETYWRVAIIDADSMLEDMVTSLGYQGSDFGGKLKSMQRDNIPWLQAAWDVHLLRNKLAHEGSRYPLNEREAYRAYKIYENILSGTGYLA